MDPHSGEQRYGKLGQEGDEGEEEEGHGAQVLPCDHDGEGARHLVMVAMMVWRWWWRWWWQWWCDDDGDDDGDNDGGDDGGDDGDGEGAQHQQPIKASLEPASVIDHLEEEAGKKHREEAKDGECNEDGENFEDWSQTDPIGETSPHHSSCIEMNHPVTCVIV